VQLFETKSRKRKKRQLTLKKSSHVLDTITKISITTRNGVTQNEYIGYMAGLYGTTERTMKKKLKCTLKATCDLQVFLILMALRTCLPGSSKNSIQNINTSINSIRNQ
jgi:hypothetical protein